MKRQILIALAALAAFAVPSGAVELVMVEQHGCHWCEQWNADIAPAYSKTSEGEFAPLRRVDLRALPDDLVFDARVIFTPTFVLMDDGAELARIEGYPGPDFFWPLLAEMLAEQTDFEVMQ